MSKAFTLYDVDGNPVGEAVTMDPPPLDALGVAMTLLATKGVVTTQEAADVAGRAPAELVAEAEAWAVVAAERAKPKR